MGKYNKSVISQLPTGGKSLCGFITRRLCSLPAPLALWIRSLTVFAL